ncbi:unnamed protein product [Musa hybrid cultivar]
MASLLPGFIVFSLLAGVLHGQLSPSFYATTCPNLQTIVRSVMAQAVSQEPRMGASILRLFFHDCFVNGCDASILLDDTANFTGEKNAAPNANSVRGYEVIDAIKTRVEAACNATVSCADIVALAARDGVYLLGGPTWAVPLGRRDARTASQDAANSNLPGPFSSLATLISMFDAKGLSAQDMTALSGAHTIGMARCGLFRSRIFNDANVNASFAAERKLTCPATGGDGNLAPLDELYNGGSQDALVRNYSVNATAFASDFSSAMVKLGYLIITVLSRSEETIIRSISSTKIKNKFSPNAMEWAWESVGVTARILKRAGLVSPCFMIREELHFHHPNIVTRRLGPMLLSRGGSYDLSPTFYDWTCPSLRSIVRSAMTQAVGQDPTMGASMLRLFFHDCFVNGCDASVLLDDTQAMAGEKNAPPNRNSLRGYEVIDSIKAQVEASCRAVVSCADILALAARDGVTLLGGPSWVVALGRRDARTASISAAVANLPPASASAYTLMSTFAAKGLDMRDLTALSGAHTVGSARCSNFRPHVYNDSNIDPGFAWLRRQTCLAVGGDGAMAPLDSTSPTQFDNSYFQNLVGRRGLLHSDQELFNNGPADWLVQLYSSNATAFATDFAASMVKMGNISPLTGYLGEIRLNCRRTN